ncbi:MAG: hypothetical protein ACREF7_00720, partial [Candidatus Saccharimonadales bacterium]
MAQSKTATAPKNKGELPAREVSVTGKAKALDVAMEQIEKQFGKGAIMKMGENHISGNIEFTSSGCLSLDLALGGGIPKGRVVEVYGPESSGKTTLT